MSSFTDALLLKVHTGTLAQRPVELLETFRYWSIIGASEAAPPLDHRTGRRPRRLRTDFAATEPRSPARSGPCCHPPVGCSGKAAVIHARICDERPHSVDPRMAADIFNQVMEVLGEPCWRRSTMVWAVRWFGPPFRVGTGPER